MKNRTYKTKLQPTSAQRVMLALCVEVANNAYDMAMRHLTNNKSGSAMSADEFIEYSRYGLIYNSTYDCCPYSVWTQGVRDAYRDFGKYGKARSESKRISSFCVYPKEVKFFDTKVSIGRISNIGLAGMNRVPAGIKYYNPHCRLELGEWYISVDLPVKALVQNINKPERVCIDIESDVYINLVKAYNRLSSDIERYERKLIASHKSSNNFTKAEQRLIRQVRHIKNIILDMENKYDCSGIRQDLNTVKKAIEQLAGILNGV